VDEKNENFLGRSVLRMTRHAIVGHLLTMLGAPFRFRSALGRRTAEVRLSELHKIEGGNIDLAILKAANLVPANTLQAKIVLSGDVKSAFTVTGVGVTKGARAAIEKAGGKIVEPAAA